MAAWNPAKGKRERIGRLVQMRADKRDEIDEVLAGDIAAAVGLKLTTTGDTLCDEHHPIVLERMEFPEPVIDIAIEPKTKADQDKLGTSLQKLSVEDPSFRVRTDPESGQTLIAGMGELHLEIIVDRLLREFKVEANVGKPQVAYRETISQSVEARGQYVRQSGGRGQYGDIVLPPLAERGGEGLHQQELDRRRQGAEGVRGGRVPGRPGVDEQRAARRLPDGGRARGGHRRELPRRGLERGGVPDRRVDGGARGRARGPGRCCSSRSCRSRW